MKQTWIPYTLVESVSVQVTIKFATCVASAFDVLVYRQRAELATVNAEGRWVRHIAPKNPLYERTIVTRSIKIVWR